MLHITNGSSVQLKEAGLSGDVEYWADVLHEGPVPPLPWEELAHVRANFIAGEFDLERAAVLADFERRYARVREARGRDEIVLWFEHDLYDQLQLIQLLDYVAGTPVALIQTAAYLGTMSPAELAALFPRRQPVTPLQFELASSAWAAFRSPNPGPIATLLAGDLNALPHLRAAMLRHAEQFPSRRDGLSRTERQILTAIANGASTVRDAFLADQQMEDAIFMGDSTFVEYVQRLADCRTPLLTLSAPASTMGAVMHLTPAGESVLAGRADHATLNSIDCWRGGVHLSTTGQLWRWNGSSFEL